MNTSKDIRQNWTAIAKKQLEGRTIVKVRYMTASEANDHDWDSLPVVMVLDNGNIIYPSRDDEGNDGGALFTTDTIDYVLPVISREE